MQKKNWYHNLRLKLLVGLCAVLLLGQGLFVRPALARPALAAHASDRDMSYSVISRGSTLNSLDIFIVRSCEIWMKSWTGSAWTTWRNLGRAPTGDCFFTVSAVAAGNNRWDIFSTVGAASSTVWHKAFDGRFSETGWESRGSVGLSSGAGVQAVSTGNGRIDLFTRATCPSTSGCGSALWKVRSATGVWSPCDTCAWSVLDNTGSDFSFTALAHSGTRIDLFRGPASDTRVFRKSFNGTSWAPVNPFTRLPLNQWQNMNGDVKETPYAVSWGTNRIDVFVRGLDDNVYINNTNDAGANWFGWGFLGRGNTNPLITAVSAVAWGPNRLDIFTADGGTVYHKVWDGANWWPSQTGWQNIGTMLASSFDNPPLPVSWGPNRIDLFKYEGTVTKTLYHKSTNDGINWAPSDTTWENLGP